jgi:two-component system LytT family sensor kinase
MSISSPAIRRLARAYAISIAVWVPIGVLTGLEVHGAYQGAHVAVSLQAMVLLQTVRYFIVALLTPPIFYCVDRWPVTSAKIGRAAAYVAISLPFTLVFVFMRLALLPPLLEDASNWGKRTFASFVRITNGNFADVLQLYLAIVVAAHAYTYFTRGKRQEIERLELLQSLAQSELQALRAQLHPHFLFNALQGISTLIDTNRTAAKDMLHALAGLLRTALKHGSTDLVSFREELEFVTAYLELEQMRFGKRLQVRWDIATETTRTLLPQLLLQPLIENAIVHGIANSRAGGWIELWARVENGRLRVRITNSVASMTVPGSGVGLSNARARLKYLYEEDGRFEFQLNESRAIATAEIDLPALFTEAAPEPTATETNEKEPQCAS